MKKIAVLSALALVLALSPAYAAKAVDDAPAPMAALSAQDQADLKRVEDYLNTMKPLQADFLQRAQQFDGSLGEVRGVMKLWRPGRLRIDYASPSGDFIVADGRNIYQWDNQLRQQSQTGIMDTPAGFILKKDIKFSGDDITVVKVAHPKPEWTEITVRSAKDPQLGELTLIVNNVPLRLDGWRVLDAQGLTTEVLLSNLQADVKFASGDFTFRNPDFARNRNK